MSTVVGALAPGAAAGALRDLLAYGYVLRLATRLDPPAEAVFPGYRPAVLYTSLWEVRAGPPAVAEAPEQAFVRASGEGPAALVVGAYLTRADTGALRWAWAFAESFPMARTGDRLALAPRVSLEGAA